MKEKDYFNSYLEKSSEIQSLIKSISDKLDKAFHVLKGHGKITEVNV